MFRYDSSPNTLLQSPIVLGLSHLFHPLQEFLQLHNSSTSLSSPPTLVCKLALTKYLPVQFATLIQGPYIPATCNATM